MKIFRASVFLLCLISIGKLYSQESITLQEDKVFKELLNQKNKTSNSQPKDKYAIQIYSGNKNLAESTFNNFKKNFPQLEVNIVYKSPNYKVWVGNFKTRLQAYKYLKQIETTHSSSVIIRPTKK